MSSVAPLLHLSALGIYFHAFFVSLTLGLPFAIAAMLWMSRREGGGIYMRAAKLMTRVLVLNFALGAITGTLVEFGLVQVWPGVNLAIATAALAPLALELIAFTLEIALLVLFYVTLGRVKALVSIAVIALYTVFAFFSAFLITAVNSWMQAPWGTGALAQALYPFMPEFGPDAVDEAKLVALKVSALAEGVPVSVLLERPGLSEKLGVVLEDPLAALYNPYAAISALHNILAGVLIALSLVVAAWAYRYYRTGAPEYLSILKPLVLMLAVLFVLQAPVFAHFMGEAVVKFNPTKFAMMEGARETYHNPVVALIAYGDPSKPIQGFDAFYESCEKLGGLTLGELARKLDLYPYLAALDSASVQKLEGVKLRDLCVADLRRAERLLELVHYAYYAKVAAAVVGGLAVAALLLSFVRIPLLSPLAVKVTSLLGGERRRILILSALAVAGTVTPSALGWAVREVGRKPWTVYGLLTPEELATPVPLAQNPAFIAWAALFIAAVGLAGVCAMYLVASKSVGVLEKR
ncbi:MAG: cytochrome ubiquinol oxidase subunit I [Thermofilum sp.]